MLLFFIFDLHFVVVSSFVDVLHFVVVLHSHFLFDVIPHRSMDCRRIFTPHFILSAQPVAEGYANTSIFRPFRYLLAASATALSGHFVATNGSYLMLLHRHSTCIYQGLLGSRQFFLEVYRASY